MAPWRMLTSGWRRTPMTAAERRHRLLASARRGSTRNGDSGGRATAHGMERPEASRAVTLLAGRRRARGSAEVAEQQGGRQETPGVRTTEGQQKQLAR
ncbi:hypothetical protein E2562_003109 [Oryza meyeriana var. granulata]|uniref:Uncharacterized protein n=1 Tax=Oryza meyeriana var. granulata TaxID=110450 RepID=A0A6G1E945_9ORYZ|nr:hypothetical protein E2562_003109 [Oryza meyeriana var. granulata]